MADHRRSSIVRDIGDDRDQRSPATESDDRDIVGDQAVSDRDKQDAGRNETAFNDDQDDAELDDDQPAAGANAKPGAGHRAGGKKEPAPRRDHRADANGANGGNGGNGGDRPTSREATPVREAALNVKEAAKAALRQLMELTGKPAESITGVTRTEDGWMIGIEMVEDRRIPSSADILAMYQAEIDKHGELVSYHRVRRYARGRGNDDGGR